MHARVSAPILLPNDHFHQTVMAASCSTLYAWGPLPKDVSNHVSIIGQEVMMDPNNDLLNKKSEHVSNEKLVFHVLDAKVPS